VLQLVEYLHSKCFVHRDITPASFRFGVGSTAHHVYMNDFETCATYWVGTPGHEAHIPFRKYARIMGTPYFMSQNVLRGEENSRRDDLESVGYVILHLLQGSLPWIQCKTREQIAAKKAQCSVHRLCQNVPAPLHDFMSYVFKLQFSQRPNYDKLFNFLDKCRPPETRDYAFAWLVADPDFDAAQLQPLLPRSAVQPDQDEASFESGYFSSRSASTHSCHSSGCSTVSSPITDKKGIVAFIKFRLSKMAPSRKKKQRIIPLND